MRERIFQAKKAASPVSISTLKQPTRGFGLESWNASPPAMTQVQPLNKPLTHDISKISLRPQAKLSISQPGDTYEQEADSVARQVMQRMALSGNRQSIQRQEVPEEEEELQMKPLEISTLQRQEAPEEEEELQMKPLDISTLQRQEAPEEEEELQMKPLEISTLQRQEVSEEEEELQMKPMVQRQANGGMAATADLETSINQARGGGQPLGDNIREPMEQAFGADFGGVKVHTDSHSDGLNRSIQARAFTTGQDIFFRQGEYNPGSPGGQELLAHELTHVVQQNGGMVQRSPKPKTYLHEDEETTTASATNSKTIQRQIYYVTNIPAPQFQIDDNRPNWLPVIRNLMTGNGQSRNHIIAFEVIQNDLCRELNNLIANPQHLQTLNLLENLTDALYTNMNSVEYNDMINQRQLLITAIQHGNAQDYENLAQQLLTSLNSSPDNVRVGDSSLNTSIGYWIDAEFEPGKIAYTGSVRTSNGIINVRNRDCLILTQDSESIVYRYQKQTGLSLSFVINGLQGSVHPAAQQGQHLSSTQLPTVAPAVNQNPFPVLVRDPAGVDDPYLYE
ncbi:hypothetical protein SR1949_33860 [Sphaerospermopsis reniformis]|uniref:eCIS core domain-containing protein n=1 Tax=Sphaerospermopsis reniformis TaxID=531300 RepID=A0A480A1B7_9CYAN|nr:DUF4157 domain-containing protein [Sphaerospermopsis reniformis]GCL38272.1 hypothetical protein SR1949_33860 [Sphaerospermopsis reniformis]